MADITSLPSEILDNVCGHLPTSALPSLALASSSLCLHAQRSLFRHIAASPVHRNLSVVPTIAKRPHLAKLVRFLTVSIPPDFVSQNRERDLDLWDGRAPPRETALLRGFYTALTQLLRHTTELISLALLVDPRVSWVLPPDVCYPRLQRFACTFTLSSPQPPSSSSSSSPSSLPPLAVFLAHTPALRELEIESGHEMELSSAEESPVAPGVGATHPHSLPRTLLPNLASFTGSPLSAAAVVPGRPVSHVHLLYGTRDYTPAPAAAAALAEEDGAILASLAQSAAEVRMLKVATASAVVPFLEALRRSLPAIAHLQVGTTYAYGKAWDAEFYDDVAYILDGMPALSTFELSGMCWPCGGAGCADLDSARPHSPRGWRPTNLPLPAPPSSSHYGGEEAHDDGFFDPADPDQTPWVGEPAVTGLVAPVPVPAGELNGTPGSEYDFFDYLP